MLDLPATERLQAEHDELATEAERRGIGWRTRHTRELSWADYRLELGQQRDTIQATRPDGCWCLGLGGKYPRSLPMPPPSEEVVTSYDKPCVCPEALAVIADLERAREKYRRGLMEARLARVFGQTELVPYQDARMETVIVDRENADGWEIMRAWVDLDRPDVYEKSLLIHGPIGTGKTFAAVALMRRRIELGEAALFLLLSDFLDAIKATFGRASDGSEGATTEDVLDAPRRVPLLVLDDLGAEYGTPWAESQIFGLLNARLNAGLSTLFTTNHDLLKLRRRAGERISSRVIGMCGGVGGNIVAWMGTDRRL